MGAEETASSNHVDVVEVAASQGPMPAEDVVVLKGEPFTARVRRPIHTRKRRRGGEEEEEEEAKEEKEEVMRVRLTLRRHQFYHMNLFINLPSASATTPIAACPEFVSAFNHTPLAPIKEAEDLHTTLFCVGIGDIVSQLGLSLHSHLLLTFVPTGRFKDAPVTINAITIDLE